MIVDRENLIELSGLAYSSVMARLKAAGIDNDADFYDVFVLRYLKRERMGRPRAGTEAEKKPALLYKVSALDGQGRWIVKAVCLSRTEARDMSAELNASGIKARFRPHSYGIKPRQTHED